MAWNDVVSNVKDTIRRGLARIGGREVAVAAPGTRLEPLGDAPLATPVVDVYENDRELLIVADVPGGAREGTTVAVDEARRLSFLVKVEAAPAGARWAAEYGAASWYRAFELPDGVDGSRATSTLRDGVLTIRVPKRAASSKLIPVRAG
jgi:HSP20 family molecular chaperone IbpA